jgi:flagellar hook-basal body complex protein FliE
MTPIASLPVSASTAVAAYSRVDQDPLTSTGATGADFSATLQRAIGGAISTGETAEAQATQAITGGGNLTEVVTALSRAELTLQTATTIRDRVVQAYQDIMKMPI